jgi:hypothetical protein
MMRTTRLCGLPDARPVVRAALVHSRTEAIRTIGNGRAITTAGGTGALNVWKDKKGMWRAEFFRQYVRLGELSSRTKSAVYEWLKKWWPELGRD